MAMIKTWWKFVGKDSKDHKENGCSSDKIKCDVCEKYFKDEETLEEHKKTRHGKFECDECEKGFKYEIALEKHKEAGWIVLPLFQQWQGLSFRWWVYIYSWRISIL